VTDGSYRPTVLVVDDDPRALKLMQVVLEHAGYRVLIASDGLEAQAKAVSMSPDLVVADLMMPGMNGIEFCRWVRRSLEGRTPGTMLLTAMDTSDTRLAAAEAGIDETVTKPFDRSDFLRRLEHLLRARRG